MNGSRVSGEQCSNCGSDALQKRGFHRTKVSKFQRFQCTDCGSWHRGRDNLLDKHTRPEVIPL